MRYFIVFFLFSQLVFSQKQYQKTYYDNGRLESAGWIEDGKKIKYWYYYHNNGNLKAKGHYNDNQKTKFWAFYNANGIIESEGHFKHNKRVLWWIYYDAYGKVIHKCQLKDNQKNGYCLMYTNEKLTSAIRYSLGKKIKEWTDFKSFKRENKLSDLK